MSEQKESFAESTSYLKKAVPLMIKYQIPTTPTNYALWYTYVAQTHPQLNAALDNTIAQSGACSPLSSELLYHEHLAAQTEAVAKAAVRARTVYDAATAAASTKHEQEVHRAYERGKGVAAGIRSGTVRVRDVWQDCSGGAQALPGQGTGLAPGAEAVTAGRADAIGRVLGQAGGWDADYEKALTRLRDAQVLVNQCYEEPATR